MYLQYSITNKVSEELEISNQRETPFWSCYEGNFALSTVRITYLKGLLADDMFLTITIIIRVKNLFSNQHTGRRKDSFSWEAADFKDKGKFSTEKYSNTDEHILEKCEYYQRSLRK